MLTDKWIITDKTFNNNGTITYTMKSVDIWHTIPDKKLTSIRDKAFVGTYTDSELNSISKKYNNFCCDIGTVESTRLINYNPNEELFCFLKFFNGKFGDFYSALPFDCSNKLFAPKDRILLGMQKTQDGMPYFVFVKNITTGKSIDDFETDAKTTDYQEFVVIGKGQTEIQEDTKIANEVIIKTYKFGTLRTEFSFLGSLPLFITKPGDKLLIECRYNPIHRKYFVDILRNITVDNIRSEYLLSQDVR